LKWPCDLLCILSTMVTQLLTCFKRDAVSSVWLTQSCPGAFLCPSGTLGQDRHWAVSSEMFGVAD